MYNPYSVGKIIYLRAPSESDLEGNWYQWFSDESVTQYLMDRYWPNTPDSQREFYNSITNSKDRMVLSICDLKTDAHIGTCNISFINWVHRYADIALVIGEKDFRTGPVAVETMSLLLKIAFNRLNLLNLKISYISSNKHTEALEKLFRFKQIGRFEKMVYDKGSYADIIYSQLSRDDWAKRSS